MIVGDMRNNGRKTCMADSYAALTAKQQMESKSLGGLAGQEEGYDEWHLQLEVMESERVRLVR
jgi:hypothetical protein